MFQGVSYWFERIANSHPRPAYVEDKAHTKGLEFSRDTLNVNFFQGPFLWAGFAFLAMCYTPCAGKYPQSGTSVLATTKGFTSDV